MVDACASFFQKSGNGAGVIHGLEQFDMGLAQSKKGGAHFLRGQFFYPLALQAQRLFVKSTGLFNGVNKKVLL